MIRKFISGHRLQTAADRSHQFMSQCNHFGERIDLPERPGSGIPPPHPSSAQLKELLKARRARADFFGAHLFADPAWDILLLTYVAFLDQEPLLVRTLLRTSLLPATTMLRWIGVLERDGWLEHTGNSTEDPQSFLGLSPAGKRSMERYLAAIWPTSPL